MNNTFQDNTVADDKKSFQKHYKIERTMKHNLTENMSDFKSRVNILLLITCEKH